MTAGKHGGTSKGPHFVTLLHLQDAGTRGGWPRTAQTRQRQHGVASCGQAALHEQATTHARARGRRQRTGANRAPVVVNGDLDASPCGWRLVVSF